MKCLSRVSQACLLLLPAAGFSQSGQPDEKIVFVRPDPVIIASSSGVRLSADPVGGAIHAVEDPSMEFHAKADAKMNLLAVMNPDGSGNFETICAGIWMSLLLARPTVIICAKAFTPRRFLIAAIA